MAWYHHFTHIACAKNLRGLRQKLDALHVQNEQSLSKSKGSDANSSVRKGFQISKHISTQDFLCIQYVPFKATSSLFKPFLTSFPIFHAFTDFFWAKWPWNWKALQMNSEKVETWHGIIQNPDTSKEIVHFVHEVHPVFVVTLSNF